MSHYSRKLVMGLLAACFLLVAEVPRSQAGQDRPNWHEDVFFGIHYDFHASASHKDIGKNLTPELLRERLLRVRPDWIHADCKGVYGYTSWPTKVGSTAPGLQKDMLRTFRQVTKELGMNLGVHYCTLWDERALELHPEWARVDAKGKRDTNRICMLSGYAEQLMIPQMLEVIDNYDVDGFWVDADNWWARPCWCDRCKGEFTRRTGIKAIPTEEGQPNWARWLAFHREVFVEHVTRYANAIHGRKPTCMVTSNWMYGAWQPDAVNAPVDYLTGDTAPQHFEGTWTTDGAALEARIFDSRNMSWDLMPWIFDLSSSMGEEQPLVTRPATHLQQDVAEIVALGGAVMIYEQPHSDGWLTDWHHDVLKEVADFARARKEFCFKTKTVPEAAVLHLAEHHYANNEPLFAGGRLAEKRGDSFHSVLGAFHALIETHRSTDVLLEDTALTRTTEYKLVVVPEQTRLSHPLVEALVSFARSGGIVVMSGDHLARDYANLVGASPRGEPLPQVIFLPVGARSVPVTGPWQPVAPAPGTESLTQLLDGPDPKKNTTDQTVVTKRRVGKGAILAIHGPVFRDYAHGHYPLLREFIASLIDGLGIPWRVTVNGPPRLELVLRQKDNKLMVNLINRGSGEALSALRTIPSELPPILDVQVDIRHPQQPKSVSLEPGRERVKWEYENGRVSVRVPRVDIHRILVIE